MCVCVFTFAFILFIAWVRSAANERFVHPLFVRRTIVDDKVFSLASRFHEVLVLVLVYEIINVFFFFEVAGIVV